MKPNVCDNRVSESQPMGNFSINLLWTVSCNRTSFQLNVKKVSLDVCVSLFHQLGCLENVHYSALNEICLI